MSHIGKVIYYEKDRGFGFIESAEFDNNLFFHVKELRKSKVEDLNEGKKVMFYNIVENGKGLSAQDVELLD